jgi:nucleoside-diphosphate-sugar epimerase
MNVLLTGAGGFIPSHVAEAILGAGHTLRALVHYNNRGAWGHLQHLAGSTFETSHQLEVHLGDVTDPYQMQRLAHGCDAIVHMAALIGIPYSYHAPAAYLATNTAGALHILEAARTAGVRRVILTSTSEVYGTAIYSPIDEHHPLQAQSPYAASKIAADKLAEAYYRSFDLPVTVLRPFNTYGPRQSARAVIPTVLSQVLSGSAEIALGSLAPRRDLTYVTDTARAFVLALTAPDIEGEVIHFGSGEALSVGLLAAMCINTACRLRQKEVSPDLAPVPGDGGPALAVQPPVAPCHPRIVQNPDRLRPEKSEVQLLLCNPVKAQHLLGWQPQISLSDGLERTARYIHDHLSDYAPTRYAI